MVAVCRSIIIIHSVHSSVLVFAAAAGDVIGEEEVAVALYERNDLRMVSGEKEEKKYELETKECCMLPLPPNEKMGKKSYGK